MKVPLDLIISIPGKDASQDIKRGYKRDARRQGSTSAPIKKHQIGLTYAKCKIFYIPFHGEVFFYSRVWGMYSSYA